MSTEIDEKTKAAYKQLGAAYGELWIDSYKLLRYSWGTDLPVPGGLPSFRLCSYCSLESCELPPVQVPFGLRILYRRVTEKGLSQLEKFQNLTALKLAATEVTDAGLKEVSKLKNLKWLDLCLTPVTDVGLEELKKLQNLTYLGLYPTKVTAAGVKALREALPNCHVTYREPIPENTYASSVGIYSETVQASEGFQNVFGPGEGFAVTVQHPYQFRS